MAVSCAVSPKSQNRVPLDPRKQKTLQNPISISGIGLFTAEEAILTLRPAPEGTGIVFRRIDLEGAPEVEALLENVVSTPRCTIIGKNGVTIHTVEHVLAALKGEGIDNAYLELTGPEVPIMDGSSLPFVESIETAGIEEQASEKTFYKLEQAVYWSKGDIQLIALPASEYRISYTLHFPSSAVLHAQFYSSPINEQEFSKEIAASRTFCFYEEILPFIENGLIKGGGLDNAVIIKNDRVINPEGVRFSDEMVRHKILDLTGDLSLIPGYLQAHIIAIRSGHASNIAFAKHLTNHMKMETA